MATVDPVYTPVPISQRDGSSLASSNCRMASIATGLDYHTKGRDKSTGSKMRTYTSDQSGGTDSGDAVEAWRNGYAETLSVRDGYTFDNALADLRAGAAVHLDVWHASAGGPCLSGSGAYGHTMFVLPDELSDGTKWRVADPWCSPGRWDWWPESKLRAGAEEWGRRVYGSAVMEADYPTGGSGRIGDPRHPAVLAIIRRIVRALVDAHYPGNEDPDRAGPPTPPDWETGGGKPILYTRTAALGVAGGGGGGDDVALAVIDRREQLGDVAAGVDFYEAPGGARLGEMSKAFSGLHVLGVPMDKSEDGLNLGWRAVWVTTGAVNGVTSDKVVYVQTANITNLRAIPPAPTPEPPDGDVEEAVAERDEEWRVWLLGGSPGYEDEPA